jgi:hypothetical protein
VLVGAARVGGKVRVSELAVGLRGFVAPWAVFVDGDWRFWLNGNYTVHPEPGGKACMGVARTEEGYFVGLSGCPGRTWSPRGGYSDPLRAHRRF